MKTRRDRWLNPAIVLISIAFALAVGEAGVRVFMDAPLYSRYTPEGTINSEGVPDAGFYENTPLGKRLKVNAKGFVRNHHLTGTDIPLRTNKFGFRGPEVEFDDRLRGLFLGDSITLGDYLVEEKTFVHLVGEMSKNSSTSLQTINAGVGSIGIEEEYNILRETGHLVEPDLVVLNLYLNDIQASPALHLIPIPQGLQWSRIAQHVYQVLSVRRYDENKPRNNGWIPAEVENSWKRQAAKLYPPGPGDWRKDRPAYNQMMLDWFGDWGSAYSEGGRERILRFVQRIVDLSNSLGAQPLVVIHPTRFQVEADFNANEPQQAFVAYMKKAAVPVLDLLPAMRNKYAADSRRLFYDHCHHNIEGSVFVANLIYPFIMQSIQQSAID